ncbi:MAG: glycosyltransferase, partial [Fusicatenibacter saccharivorans]
MERMTEKQVAKNTIEKLAIVVVTYKRQQLLATLFESIEKLTVAPWRIVVVDNEHSDATQGMVDDFREAVTAQWGNTIADQSGNESRVVYAPQSDNLGGAGGFSAGVKKAYELGSE